MGRGVLGANLTWEESSAGIEILSVVKKWAPFEAFLMLLGAGIFLMSAGDAGAGAGAAFLRSGTFPTAR